MAADVSFLGRGWAFPPRFDTIGRGAAMAVAEEDIAQSLRILFSTTPGERTMQPAYGCDLKFMVFEEIDEGTVTDIKDAVERAVRHFEVRIILNFVEVDASEWFEGILRLRLDYTVRATNTRNNLVFPLYRHEGSGVGHKA
jgi:uncharacterized protein